ncbi:MAG: PHP domain-containing protein, partial [Tepidiformaceae bacterium]
MGRADLHIHTRVSDGLASVEQTLEYIEHHTGLDVVAITDHEDVAGGLRARELAATRGYRFQVVVGAEITTLQGHLLALFIETTPPSFRRVESTLDMIHQQGGLAVVPHPMSWLTRSISQRTLERIALERIALERSALEQTSAGQGGSGQTFDAIETANPSPAGKVTRARAVAANASRWQLAETGGSDAHHLRHIGTGWTEFEGTSVAALRSAIETRST